MKTTRWIAVLTLIVVAEFTAITAQGATNKVFRITLAATGTLGALDYGASESIKVKFAHTHLINLAEGNHPSDPPGPMDALALVYDKDLSDAKLIVMDYIQMTPGVTVATVLHSSKILTKKGDQMMLMFEVAQGAGSAYSLHSGALLISGTFTLGPNGEPIAAKLSLSGYIRFIATDDAGTHEVELQMPKGKITLGEKLGEYIDP